MKNFVCVFRNGLVSAAASLTMIVAGCTPAPAPAAATQKPAAPPAATTAPPQVASGSPSAAAASPVVAASPVAAAPSDWKAEWDRLVAAAKQEGKIVVAGNPAESWRSATTSLWKRDFPEIDMEYSGVDGRNIWPKIQTERQAGQYLWDVRIGGPDEFVFTYKGEWLDPIRPILFHPDVVDDSKWYGGLQALFADNEKQYAAAFVSYMNVTVKVNRDVLPLPAMTSSKELLDPQWKGKIVIQDPRGGSGLSLLTVLMSAYGEDFVRELLSKQEVIITSDSRQMVEWVIRGRYPIGIGVSEAQLASFANEGVKANIENIPDPDGPRSLAVGPGGVVLLNRAPHPNAAKLLVNWLLTRDVQVSLLEKTLVNSRRVDVPIMDPSLKIEPQFLKQSFESQFEDFLPKRQRMQEIATQVLQ